jgi:methionyl-tRNA formyltransferase
MRPEDGEGAGEAERMARNCPARLDPLKSRVVFMGTAELACASLEALAASPGFEVVAVVTQPDRPKGRDLKLQPSPVKEAALRAGLRVLQPKRAREAGFLEELRRLEPLLIAVAAYGQLLPPAILTLPPLGCFNVHASLLPKYRGAAPIQWAILNDESETGVTIMKMAEQLDTGDILAQRATAIAPEDTAATLRERLARIGAQLLAETLANAVKNSITARPQDQAEATCARKIAKEDGRLDWSQSARSLWNRVRALVPWPGAFTSWPAGAKSRTMKIWRASVEEVRAGAPGAVARADKAGIVVACGGGGALRIQELQLEGGRRLEAAAFLAGHPLRPGDRMG